MKEQIVQNIIRKLLKGDDYRIEVISLINSQFLIFAMDFFKKIINAKLDSQDITVDWYKEHFINNTQLQPNEIAINAGLNKKTIHNMFNSSTKEIVIDASNQYYDSLCKTIQDLTETESDIDLTLTIKFQGVSVDLNVNESLVVINVLAVKRAELRGGLWSSAGKNVEKPLMQTLCKLYSVSNEHYAMNSNNSLKNNVGFKREVDFYLIEGSNQYNCEVKLMGKGNPESADAVIARSSKVFVADKLSDTNKRQLNDLGVEWVELRSNFGFRRFEKVLDSLRIPHGSLPEDIDKALDKIFQEVFDV